MSGNFKLLLTLSPCAKYLHFSSPNKKENLITLASVATVAPCGVQKKVEKNEIPVSFFGCYVISPILKVGKKAIA